MTMDWLRTQKQWNCTDWHIKELNFQQLELSTVALHTTHIAENPNKTFQTQIYYIDRYFCMFFRLSTKRICICVYYLCFRRSNCCGGINKIHICGSLGHRRAKEHIGYSSKSNFLLSDWNTPRFPKERDFRVRLQSLPYIWKSSH